jgi:hypothetical protein
MKEVLARRWGISLDLAHQMVRMTTLRGVCPFVNPTDQRVSTHHPHLAFLMMKNKRMYADTMFAKVKSIQQNTCAQVYTDGQGYSLFYPMQTKKDATVTLLKMVHDMQGVSKIVVLMVLESRLVDSRRRKSTSFI